MRRALLLAASALAMDSGASARVMPGVHGPTLFAPLSPMTITFGAETLAGFGGYHLPSNIAFSNLRDAENNTSLDIVLDGNGDLVPRGSYAGAPPAFNGPYEASISNGLSSTTLTINIAPNSSTVKSHYGFATPNNPDSSTSFQLNTVLASTANIHLGDTVVIRGGSGETGPTPALNPLNQNTGAGRYFVHIPETSSATTYTQGGNTASSRITVQCEVANTAIDANGNPVEGGNCDVGGLVIASTYEVSIPIDFFNIHFYNNHISVAPTVTPYSDLVSYQALGYGVGFYNNRFEFGPSFTRAYARLYTFDSLVMRLGTAQNNHFVGGENGIVGGDQNVTAQWFITGNTFEGMVSDGVDYDFGGADATGNFFFNFNGGTPNPEDGDAIVVNGQKYTFRNSPAVAYDIPLSTNPDQSTLNAACSINANGANIAGQTCLVGINYLSATPATAGISASWVAASTAAPTDELTLTNTTGASITLSTANVTYGTSKSSTAAWSTTSLANGATASLILSPDHSDTFQYDDVMATMQDVRAGVHRYNISVGPSGSVNSGARQFFFQNPTYQCCYVGGDIRWNITNLTAGNQIITQRFNNPNVSFNTTLSDPNSTAYVPTDPSYDTLFTGVTPAGSGPGWYSSINRSSNDTSIDGGGGGTYIDNLANSFSIVGAGKNVETQTTNGSIANYTFTGTIPSNGSTTLDVIGTPVPILGSPLSGTGLPANAFVYNLVGNVITLYSGSGVLAETNAPFTATDPYNGHAPGTLTVSGNESVNWSGSAPNLPTDGTTVTAYYKTFLPNYPSTASTPKNRAAAIVMATPSMGNTFAGSISSMSTPYTLTVTSGTVPAVNTPINGPDIPSGDVVTGVSGSTLTLLFAPTGTGTGLLFGTGAMNPGSAVGNQGTYNGALFPNGCWNDNSVYNPATACAAAQ